MVKLVSVVGLVWVEAKHIWVLIGKIQKGEAGQGGKLAGDILVEAVEIYLVGI